MKFLLAAAGLAILLSSCRTFTPIDPNTGKPSKAMLPENFHSSSGQVHASK